METHHAFMGNHPESVPQVFSRINFRTWLWACLLLTGIFSCRKNDLSNNYLANRVVDTTTAAVDTSTARDTILVANAGADQVVWLPNPAVLDASKSTYSKKDSIRYNWKFLDGPSKPVIVDSLAKKTLADSLRPGNYQFELTISTTNGRSSKDTLLVQVVTTWPHDTSTCIFPGSAHMADFTGGRVEMSAISFHNKFYYMNGESIDIYDPVSNTITNSARLLSLSRASVSLVSNGEKMFIAGGFNSGSESRVDIFDASSNSWSTAELSQSRYVIDASTIGDKVFFSGGMQDPYKSSARMDIYDMKNKTWSYRELGVSGIYTHAIIGNKLWLMTFDHVEKYDPVEDKWSSGSLGRTLPSFCNNAIELDNKIYLTGDREVAVYDIESGTWSSFYLKENVFLVPAIACNHKLVFVGGMTSWFNYSTTMEIYDPATGSINLLKMDADLYYESLLTYDNYIYSAGGMINQENTLLSGICRFRY